MDASERSAPALTISPTFLREVALWAAPLAAVAAVAGSLTVSDWRFGVSCVLGATFDIATVLPMAARIDTAGEHSGGALAAVGPWIAGRFALKGVLLVAAALLPTYASLAGTAVGVLAFDMTLITVGAALSAVRTFRVAAHR